MLRQWTEKKMETEPGEQRFSLGLRRAYFKGIGPKPPNCVEKIQGARLSLEEGVHRIDLDLVRVYSAPAEHEERPKLRPRVFADAEEAMEMRAAMNDPANIARANRVLFESGRTSDGLVCGGVVGGGALLTMFSS